MEKLILKVCFSKRPREFLVKDTMMFIAGGIILHQGKIAEMKTGEGKTCLYFALFLNSLGGKGVHINCKCYLAKRLGMDGESF